MPVTRRKRANPPDQPENNNHLAAQSENLSEAPASEQAVAQASELAQSAVQATETPAEVESPAPATSTAPTEPALAENTPYVNLSLPSVTTNGEHAERQEYTHPALSAETSPAPPTPTRRTSFRRPVQSPMPPAAVVPSASTSVVPSMAHMPPTHEISLPLGNLLHLAYNPSYTGSEEARSTLLHKLAHESKTGGRARCWSCGSLAIAYDYWNTRSKSFGEVGIAFCEICGVWSVM